MVCMGSIYAWSIIATELIENYSFSVSQSQSIFGLAILTFPLTMILIASLKIRRYPKIIGYLAAFFYSFGYLIASYSQGNFLLILLGIGLLSGIGTGLGYWLALTYPVQCFPHRKGFVTGLVSAGFGFGAVFMSEFAELFFSHGYNVFEFIRFMAISYGSLIFISSNFCYSLCWVHNSKIYISKLKELLTHENFWKLFLGIFLGTFAGLIIIGSLRMIGKSFALPTHTILRGIAFFSLANFIGRIVWGFISDYYKAKYIVFIALLMQSLAILALIVIPVSEIIFQFILVLIGFAFGGNFVLFAKETAHTYGIDRLGIIYPYVFMGYAMAGILGPLSGGLLYDSCGSYSYSILLASLMSMLGALIFLSNKFQRGIK